MSGTDLTFGRMLINWGDLDVLALRRSRSIRAMNGDSSSSGRTPLVHTASIRVFVSGTTLTVFGSVVINLAVVCE
jgi:hypothetical protein